MKKLLPLLWAALYLASCGKTHTIEYPAMESYNSFRVHKIELTDSATIIHAGAYAFEEYWFRLQGDKGEYYLAGRTTGNRYQLLGIEGIELNLKSATKLFSVLLASKRPLITELADKLRLKYPLLPTISPCPTMRLEAIRSIIPISCRRYPKSV